jgi:cell division protein FtsI/penicillin-binding protein 2
MAPPPFIWQASCFPHNGACGMNQRIRRLTVALIALFAILFVQLTTWQVVKQDELKEKAQQHARAV